MKAIVYTAHGGPDVLQFKEVEMPVITENQLLIKVHTAAANALDSHRMRGIPGMAALMDKLFKSKRQTPGADLSGWVEAVGSGVKSFKVGDKVFGAGRSTFAEYAISFERTLVLKPVHVAFESAATIGVAGLTALQGLRDYGKIQAGQSVLIHGAGGGVGTFAVQIAKSFATEVTAVCSTKNLEMVRSIGADHVIDYSLHDFTRSGKRYDLIMAVNGYHSHFAYRRALNPHGILVMAGASKSAMGKALLQAFFLGPILSLTGKQKFRIVMAKIKNEDLLFLSKLLEAGKLKPVIDRQFPLSDAADAIRYLEEWHSGGKIIVRVSNI